MNQGYPSAGGQLAATAQTTPRESTALERHHGELMKLERVLGDACDRAEKIADRLLGSEPTNIGNNKGQGPIAEPPMLNRLEQTVMNGHGLATSLHQQLDRLERL